MSARGIIESAVGRFYDQRAYWLHGSNAEFSQFKRFGRGVSDSGGIFFVKDSPEQEKYARSYGKNVYRCRISLSPDQVFELPVAEHVERVSEVRTEDAIGDDFLRSAFSARRYGHADWSSVDQEVLELAGFKGIILAERPKGFAGYGEDILSLCVFDSSVIQIVAGEVEESKMPEPHWRVTVQEPVIPGNPKSGYIQIDKLDPSGRGLGSFSPEQLEAEGYDLPDLTGLRTGRYTFAQLSEAAEVPGAERDYHVELVTDVTRPSRHWDVKATSFANAFYKAMGESARSFKVRYSERHSVPTKNPAYAQVAIYRDRYRYVRVTLK